MPNKENWDEIHNKGEIELTPDKWKPISIEYGYKNFNNVLFFCWRVKGTEHTFTILFSKLNELSQGDVEKHIEEFLETFRQELIGWCTGGLKQPWMREYYEQYKSFIEL